LSLDTPRSTWTARAEAALRTLRDVDQASIEAEGDEVREIHIVSSSLRQPKQIVRDVQSLLRTSFDLTIDHRVVSVAFLRPADPGTAKLRGAAEPDPGRAPEPVPARRVAPADRIRFGSVNLYVTGPRAQAQVELRWKGITRMGSASGWSTREGGQRLIAQATLAAVQEFLDEDMALSVNGLEFTRVGGQEVALVGLLLLAHRHEKPLVGSCTVEHDAQQAVVLATLAALNRVVGGLRTKEPTEYVLRPTSA
jgi:hypothetical protein